MEPHQGQDEAQFTEAGDIHALPPSDFKLGIRARAAVARIIDGDTMVVELRLPLHIRIKDCWAPEPRGPERERGLDAKRHLEQLAPVGSQVVLDVDTHDATVLGDVLTFGRVVADVERDGKSLARQMVDAGHATVRRGK